jgi:hypothetical protein
MTEIPEEPEERLTFHRDRREHGGMPPRPDEERLAELTEEERVDLGIDPYDPAEVPPATDAPVPTDITESEQYQEERAEIDREEAKGELPPKPDPFLPTRYDE